MSITASRKRQIRAPKVRASPKATSLERRRHAEEASNDSRQPYLSTTCRAVHVQDNIRGSDGGFHAGTPGTRLQLCGSGNVAVWCRCTDSLRAFLGRGRPAPKPPPSCERARPHPSAAVHVEARRRRRLSRGSSQKCVRSLSRASEAAPAPLDSVRTPPCRGLRSVLRWNSGGCRWSSAETAARSSAAAGHPRLRGSRESCDVPS